MVEQTYPHGMVEQLLAASSQRKIDWRRTAEDACFRAVLPSGMVEVGLDPESSVREEGQNQGPIPYLQVLNSDAQVVGNFHAADEYSRVQLSQLYEAARERALRQNETLQGLEKDLQKLLQG
jgi:hypothetical protein